MDTLIKLVFGYSRPTFKFLRIASECMVHTSTFLSIQDTISLRKTCKRLNKVLKRTILIRRCVRWMKYIVSPNIPRYPGVRSIILCSNSFSYYRKSGILYWDNNDNKTEGLVMRIFIKTLDIDQIEMIHISLVSTYVLGNFDYIRSKSFVLSNDKMLLSLPYIYLVEFKRWENCVTVPDQLLLPFNDIMWIRIDYKIGYNDPFVPKIYFDIVLSNNINIRKNYKKENNQPKFLPFRRQTHGVQ